MQHLNGHPGNGAREHLSIIDCEEEMFAGLTIPEECASPEEAVACMRQQPMPNVYTWREIPNTRSQFIWTAKPPGVWCVLLRFDQQLLTSDSRVPIGDHPNAVDYAAVYEMLTKHRASILCRLQDDVGLTGVAVRHDGQPFTAWVPGFHANTMINVRDLDTKGVEDLVEGEHNCPLGLNEPSTIGIQPAFSLEQPDHRADWLRKCPEGLWLLTTRQRLEIYEVLA